MFSIPQHLFTFKIVFSEFITVIDSFIFFTNCSIFFSWNILRRSCVIRIEHTKTCAITKENEYENNWQPDLVLFGGLWMGLGWTLVGLVWCISIIGIPVGIQCFKFARLAFFPFGKVIVYGGGALPFCATFCGWFSVDLPLLISAAIHGLIFCITIVGIHFGMQCFKFARLALTPFWLGCYCLRIIFVTYFLYCLFWLQLFRSLAHIFSKEILFLPYF